MAGLAQALAHGLNALLGIAALILLARALAGGFTTRLAPWLFCIAVTLTSLLAAAVRLIAARPCDRSKRRADRALRYLPGVSSAAVLVTLATASASALWLIAGALVVLLVEGCCQWCVRGARRTVAWSTGSRATRTKVALRTPAAQRAESAPRSRLQQDANVPSEPTEAAGDDGEDVVQQVLRIEMPDGTLRWQGWCRTRFGPSARHAVEHLSFCPPFSHMPHVYCRPVSGPPVRLRVSRVLPHGASVELRLASASTAPTSVTFEFTAATGPN